MVTPTLTPPYHEGWFVVLLFAAPLGIITAIHVSKGNQVLPVPVNPVQEHTCTYMNIIMVILQ